MSGKLAYGIAAAGICAVAVLTAIPASASTGAVRAASPGSVQPLITHTSGPYSSLAACAAAEGAFAAAGGDIVRNCYQRQFPSSGLGGSIGWAFDYSVFF